MCVPRHYVNASNPSGVRGLNANQRDRTAILYHATPNSSRIGYITPEHDCDYNHKSL